MSADQDGLSGKQETGLQIVGNVIAGDFKVFECLICKKTYDFAMQFNNNNVSALRNTPVCPVCQSRVLILDSLFNSKALRNKSTITVTEGGKLMLAEYRKEQQEKKLKGNENDDE